MVTQAQYIQGQAVMPIGDKSEVCILRVGKLGILC